MQEKQSNLKKQFPATATFCILQKCITTVRFKENFIYEGKKCWKNYAVNGCRNMGIIEIIWFDLFAKARYWLLSYLKTWQAPLERDLRRLYVDRLEGGEAARDTLLDIKVLKSRLCFTVRMRCFLIKRYNCRLCFSVRMISSLSLSLSLTFVVKEELMVVERRGIFLSLPDLVTTVKV